MRKLALAVVVVIALTAVAVAWAESNTTVSGTAKVTPNKAGTPKHPQGVKVVSVSHWRTSGDGEKPIVTKGIAYFPKGSLYNGGKYPKCSQSTLARSGPKACPPHSIMGTGTGLAYADTVVTRPQITIVNGGKNMVYFFTVLNNPARVQAPVPGVIQKQSGKWAYKLTLTVPKSLQIVAGVPIALQDLTITAGGKKWAPDWLATTGCSGGKWPFQVQTFYDDGTDSTYQASTPCKK